MDMNYDALSLFLYATKNRKVYLGRVPDEPSDEKEYTLKEFEIKSFRKDGNEYKVLNLIIRNDINNVVELFTIPNIESIEYSVGENSDGEIKIWFYTVDLKELEEVNRHELMDTKKYQEMIVEGRGHHTYRISIYPDMYFLDRTGAKEKIDMREFMYINPIFRERDFHLTYNKVFIAMPFTDDKYNDIYRGYIEPQIKSKGFMPLRVDEKHYPGDVMEVVWKEINESAFIVAEISNLNANVLYEIGIAHTLGKDVIILTDGSKDVPFDLTKNRYVKYSVESREMITKFLDELDEATGVIAEKINKHAGEELQIVSMHELIEIERELKEGQALLGIIRNNIVVVKKDSKEAVKRCREIELWGEEPVYEDEKMIISVSTHRGEEILQFSIDMMNEKLCELLSKVPKGKVKLETYIICDNLSDMSCKRVFKSDMSKLMLERQLERWRHQKQV